MLTVPAVTDSLASPALVSSQRDELRASALAAKSAEAIGATNANVHIVVFKGAPLATYRGEKPNLAAPERKINSRGVSRIDPNGAASRAYVDQLQRDQKTQLDTLSSALGRTLVLRASFQHAINAVVVEANSDEAARIAKSANVLLVEAYKEYEQDTDLGPGVIGAPAVWGGTYANATGSYRGEGMVVGIIDSGINFESPSFAGVSPTDAYAHINPLGSGNYLGTCATGQVDQGRCNSKLIGGYDFVCAAPGNACTTAGQREEPGFGDTNGHGSHTASTAAGNPRDVTVSGNVLRISGVAPRANIIAYDVCYTEISSGRGLCPNVSSLAAVNQTVADGIVDAINFSIGGGADPWTDTVSLAFLSAHASGIFVASSAGNSGPAANTLGHNEPWVSSTAASQTGRNGFVSRFQITGPAPVPAAIANIVATEGTGGTPLAASIPGSTPLRVSPGISTTSDGCAAFPANTFTGSIALVRRGTCSFAIKANNAAAAGAVAMVLANNQAGAIAPSVPGTTIPVFGITQADGDAVRNFGQANPATATAAIPFPPSPLANVVDALGAFSSRGPAGNYDLVKPNITAPGVGILAAVSGTGSVTGSPNVVEFYNGTSMASPHQAGAALLIRQARPTLTPSEVASAIALTAKTQVLLEDEVTLANPFGRGSGRVRADFAIDAGLVMNEIEQRFRDADPALGGAVSALNLPSIAKRSCFPTCTFTRTFRSTRSSAATWHFALTGLTGTVSPTSATVAAGATQTLTVTIDANALIRDGRAYFGEIEIKEETSPGVFNNAAAMHMPVLVSVQPPKLAAPASLALSLAATTIAPVGYNVGNVGGSALDYAAVNSGAGTVTVVNADNSGVGSGFRNIIYTDPAIAGSQAQFAADDFVVAEPTQISRLQVNGFVVSGAALTAAATNFVWSIYPDASGFPAGNPQTAPGAAVWTYTATPTATGVSTGPTTNQTITLDLIAAGQTVNLTPGRYWLVVNTRGTFANRYAQFGSNQTNGNPNFASITIATAGTGAWAANTSFAGLTMTVEGLVGCGAAWISSAFPSIASLAAGSQRNVSLFLTAGSLAAGTYRANTCVQSNDPTAQRKAIPITLTVTP